LSDEARASLAEQQAQLVAALVNSGSKVPEGFDPGRVGLAARTLASKRRKSVRRAWPVLADALGERFEAFFDRFAAEHPVDPTGPAADARAFTDWLESRGLLPQTLQRDQFASRLWRNRFPLALAMRRTTDATLLGFRLPIIGVRVLSLRRR
jgi:hypothetical protein